MFYCQDRVVNKSNLFAFQSSSLSKIDTLVWMRFIRQAQRLPKAQELKLIIIKCVPFPPWLHISEIRTNGFLNSFAIYHMIFKKSDNLSNILDNLSAIHWYSATVQNGGTVIDLMRCNLQVGVATITFFTYIFIYKLTHHCSVNVNYKWLRTLT